MVTIVNPYIAGAPVAEAKMFFGREDIFAWIERSLTGQYVDNILVIHGQRRVGKTSILKQLPNRLPDHYIPIFLDLQGRTHTSLDRFLWWMGREIGRVLKKDHGIEVQIPEREAFTDDPEKFESQFLSELREAIGGRVLLLTFDEFDMLEEAGAKAGLAQPLVTTLRRLMGTAGLAFIYSIGSSGRKLENMQAAYTDFFKAALYKKVSFLEKKEAFRLIVDPVAGVLEYDPQAVERIYQITFGHPYFTQLLCHELFSRCQKNDERRIAPADVEAVLDGMMRLDAIRRALSLMRRGGRMTSFGEPTSFSELFHILMTLLKVNLLPIGKTLQLFGTSTYFLFDKRPYLEDWAMLFRLLGEGKIKPVVAATFPILEARQANKLLESGGVTGNVVLVAPVLSKIFWDGKFKALDSQGGIGLIINLAILAISIS